VIKDHEKFIAFMFLGIALLSLAVLIYIRPLTDSTQNSGVLQILNMIIGSMIGAFGAAAGALLKSSTDTVKVDQPASQPIPTTDSGPSPDAGEELPSYAK
jgi:hypothetical protein